MIKTYYMLTKPGIILGNLITTASGFALASKGDFHFLLFFITLLGLGAIIASACIFNNYIDRYADEKMHRTKNRPFVKKTVSVPKALLLATCLGIGGTFLLGMYVNLLAMMTALAGFAIYVVVYSLLKYHWTAGTLIGSVAGAMPPVVGYAAACNQLDAGAATLFFILVLWQMPHFFSIALYRLEDYKAASIPVLPLTKGNLITKIHMLLYILAFIGAESLLLLLGYTGYIYLATAAVLSFAWLALCIKGFKCTNDVKWARQMFRFSLVVITAISVLISCDTL